MIVKDWKDPVLEIIENARKAEVINTFGEDRVFDLSATTIDEVTQVASETANLDNIAVNIPTYQLGVSPADLSSFQPSANSAD